MFFVNLNLRAAREDQGVLERFLARGVDPELGLDPVLMDLADTAWHETMAERLHAAGLRCALHLPFSTCNQGARTS